MLLVLRRLNRRRTLTTKNRNRSADSEGLDPTRARAVLQNYGIRPKKRLGQNFLIDASTLDRIIAASELTSQDRVLEVGAGLGALTLRLAEAAKHVLAVEYDHRFEPILRDVLREHANVQLRIGDILQMDLSEVSVQGPYRVVANIPYNITSLLIRRLLDTPHRAESLVLTLQKEVAERIIAEAGEMNLLALSVQLYGRPEIAFEISAQDFYPKPEVDSALLVVRMHEKPLLSRDAVERLFDLAHAGFQQKRKMLKNSLASGLGRSKQAVESWLREADISPSQRAQELDLEAWLHLAQSAQDLFEQ